MAKIILHIDLNKFFVRCEELKDNSLVGKPVAVGGDGRRGIVSTCSYEARKYGIHSGMPMFQAKMLSKELIVKECDFKFYELMSKEFFHKVNSLTNKVEQMSIDECFCDVTDVVKKKRISDAVGWLTNFQEDLAQTTGLYCSIGVATTKFLAKMGSDIKKPMGITVIRNKDIENIIFPLPISSFFGIGKKTYPKLERAGYKTIGDLYFGLKNNDEKLNTFFGDFKFDIISQLEGRSSNIVHTNFDDPKSLGMTRTMNYDTNDKIVIKQFFENIIDNLLFDFKKKDMLTKTVQITYKSANYDTNFRQSTICKTLGEYTDDVNLIKKVALKVFDDSYKGEEIRLIGCTLKNLKSKHNVSIQMTFDNYEKHESDNKVGLLINRLNREANKDIFIRLSDLKDKKHGNK